MRNPPVWNSGINSLNLQILNELKSLGGHVSSVGDEMAFTELYDNSQNQPQMPSTGPDQTPTWQRAATADMEVSSITMSMTARQLQVEFSQRIHPTELNEMVK